MIELCTRRRMIISIIALGVLTVLVLIWEEKLTSSQAFNQTPTPHPHNRSLGPAIGVEDQKAGSAALTVDILKASSTGKNNNECWLLEEYKIIQECAPCTQFEINSKTPHACILTGLKEIIQCTTSGKTYRSCSSFKSAEKTRFWVFESLMLLLSILSFGYYKCRSSQLERQTIKQIELRLAAGH